MEYLLLISRIIFGGYFVLNGLNHLFQSKSLAGYAASKRVPAPRFSVIASGIMVLVGGLGILVGFFIPLSVILIALFLLVVTFSMHDFWNATDPMTRMNERISFMKNIALFGASLAYLFV